MHVRRHATHLEALAPAKINLFLEVLARRGDGFHEIRTVLTGISVFDVVLLQAVDGSVITIKTRWAYGFAARDSVGAKQAEAAHELLFGEIPQGPENLAWRAADLLRKRAGVTKGAKICLVKRIPAAAGLGGASSDAAAVLLAANAAWGLHWPTERLAPIAAELGSDVPFFLMGGSAIATGRGEQLDAVRLARAPLVVVRPPVGLSTPRVYAACHPRAEAAGPRSLLESLEAGKTASAAKQLVNDLQPAAMKLTPWIERLAQEFEQQSVFGHQMSGSGSSYFAVCRSARQARRIAAKLRARNVGWVVTATTEVCN
jgi:4-diphosphocytidyl-2-C-methyl-D-erythritol kinase